MLTGTADTLDKLDGIRKLGGARAREKGKGGEKEGASVRSKSILEGLADVGSIKRRENGTR